MKKIELLKSQQLLIIDHITAVNQARAILDIQVASLAKTVEMIAKELVPAEEVSGWGFSPDGKFLIPIKEEKSG